jgi:hypothetical protein
MAASTSIGIRIFSTPFAAALGIANCFSHGTISWC